MRTTADDRKEAVRLSKHLIASSGESDIVLLLCRTVLDCQDVFVLHAPIVAAAKQLVTTDGRCAVAWQQPWADLTKAVVALHDYEKERT